MNVYKTNPLMVKKCHENAIKNWCLLLDFFGQMLKTFWLQLKDKLVSIIWWPLAGDKNGMQQ